MELVHYKPPQAIRFIVHFFSDFMSLELQDGSVLLKLDFGHGPLEISVKKDLNDGASHNIDILYDTNVSRCILIENYISYKNDVHVNQQEFVKTVQTI